jgi:hypothetical protein
MGWLAWPRRTPTVVRQGDNVRNTDQLYHTRHVSTVRGHERLFIHTLSHARQYRPCYIRIFRHRNGMLMGINECVQHKTIMQMCALVRQTNLGGLVMCGSYAANTSVVGIDKTESTGSQRTQ